MKTIFTGILAMLLAGSLINAQDTLYIYKGGTVEIMRAVADIDSITFYKPGSTVADIEGNVYKTVKIGSQVWMAENLKTRKYKDGKSIPLVSDSAKWASLKTPGYCWYNNDSAAYNATYGALYNWYNVMTGKLCPMGWHVATDSEWKTLEMYLGMSQAEADGTEMRGSDQGTKLKSTSGWNSGESGTNTSGFTALPGGFRTNLGEFYGFGDYVGWFSALDPGMSSSHDRYLSSDGGGVFRVIFYNELGVSIRCLKDE